MINLRLLGIVAAAAIAFLSFTTPVTAVSQFNFNWNGTPTSPQSYQPSQGFQVSIHDRDATNTYGQPYSFEAQHGADCGAFQGFGVGGTHTVTQYQDEVFICNNHLMTGLNGQGYGEITLTPAEELDWSNGTAKITFKVDTLRTSCRDWLSFNLQPFADNLQFTDGIGVDLYGEPKNELLFNSGASCPTTYTASDIRSFVQTLLPTSGSVSDVVSESLPSSAADRQTFEIDVSSTHVKFGMPDFNKWFVDSDLTSPLPYSRAVFQMEQHSYTPDKECNPTPTFCAANTWHWSDLSMSSAIPFTILNADKFQVAGGHTPDITDTVTFPAPAPANSFLRFESLSVPGTLQFSCDGSTWNTVTSQQLGDLNQNGSLTEAGFQMIFWPIPQGCQTVKFQAGDPFWTWNLQRNIAIWSEGGNPSPTPTPTVTPIPTPTPVPTPINITDVPCTIALNGIQVTGFCTGTFHQ